MSKLQKLTDKFEKIVNAYQEILEQQRKFPRDSVVGMQLATMAGKYFMLRHTTSCEIYELEKKMKARKRREKKPVAEIAYGPTLVQGKQSVCSHFNVEDIKKEIEEDHSDCYSSEDSEEMFTLRAQEVAMPCGTWQRGGLISTAIISREEVGLVGGNPPPGKGSGRKKGKQRKKKKPLLLMYGTVQRPPTPTIGNNVKPMRPPKNSVFAREFKLRIPLSTTGTQVFDTITILIYKPQWYYRVVGGTLTANAGPTTGLTDAAAIFREYRVKKILVQYSNQIGTSTAFPPIYVAMDPTSTPTNIGAVSSGTSDTINRYQNSIQMDAHVSSAIGYWVPKVAELADGVDNILDKGWISTDYIGTGPTASASTGVIAITYGDAAVNPGPLTTIAGILDVVYHVEFKLPEL